MTLPCDRAVHGYGDPNAHFHVVGGHPCRSGGTETGVPFTGTDGAERLQRALLRGGLLRSTGDRPVVDRTFLSYLHPCVFDGDGDPPESSYADLERFFDAELRAIAAHVLLPVGRRATEHVLERYTARNPDEEPPHATEVPGSGWLVLPVCDPAAWAGSDGDALVDALRTVRASDYRQESDLGRFLPGGDPYLVR